MKNPLTIFRAALALAAFMPPMLHAADPVVIDLWPEGVPGLKADATPEKDAGGGRAGNIHHPSLTLYRPEVANGTAVIVCPGGGYAYLSFNHEGIVPAHWLNQLGVTVFVIKNRVKEYGQPAPLQDILRAIRTVRSRAAEFGIHPDRIGVLGFSAGGHLAGAMVATDWPSLYPKAPADLVRAGYSISGVFDLTPLVGVSVNQDLRLDAATARQVSPLSWPIKPGCIFDTVVGGLESSEFKRQSRTLAETWRQSGAQTRYEEIAGTNHFTVIDALADPQSAMAARVAELALAIKA